jgi:hypothetical protein
MINLNLKTLKMLCKTKIKGYSKLNKKELCDNYNKYLACKIIQKAYRAHFYKNAVDCITMDSVNYPCFIYRTKFGKCFFYNYDSLIKYIMKSGDTRDPNTRNSYTDEDLTRLDLGAKKHFPENKYSSTLKIKKNINYARRIRNRENEILSYQLRLEELKELIILIISSSMFLWELNESLVIDNVEYQTIHLYINNVLTEFKSIYRHLNETDTFSATCLKKELMEQIELLNLPDNGITEIINLL